MDAFTLLLTIHIVCGSASLLLGLLILLLKKGDKRHKLLGKIYFSCMLSAALVALPMCFLHPNYFLFIIGIFTTYMLLTGKRYLKKKKISDVTYVDWLLTGTMLLFGIAFIVFGGIKIIQSNYFGIVFLLFGSIGILFVYQDTQNFRGGSTYVNYWLTTHIQRMSASYIATVTAFLVVNNRILPGVIAWLLPTVLITPLIVIWTRKHMRKRPVVTQNPV
ncbi:MAG: hypothetical protein EAZ89_04330 [Bacteroidetes bacterium]|nr:MAG: hypothetical protein EAZ89_04330 [Bacteroidota bacterium]